MAQRWHRDFAGNATEGLLLMLATLVGFCVLSGKWWVMGYALVFIAIGGLLFCWSLFLEYSTQEALDRKQGYRPY